MGDRTLPPQVEGHPQGRLDLIIGRPAVFPPPKASQSFIFSFRWWGDSRLCLLRLPPGKSESRITFYVTCGPRSFRQYLCDAGSLNICLKIGGGGDEDAEEEEKENISQVVQSPRKVGESPRQTVLRRQLRMKKGWQDGDVVGSFLLPDLKLNSRGDYVNECRIVDSSADSIGTVVVTMIFLEGTLEDFQEIKIQREEETTVQQKMEEIKLRPRASGIPIRGSHSSNTQKNAQDGQRSRSGSFRESLKHKSDRLKSPKRQLGALDPTGRGKGQEVSQNKKIESLNQIGLVHPEVVRRERKQGDRNTTRERPASWGLYPLLDGADPQSLVESGAVRAQDLPVLMQVLDGRSPNVDLSTLDPETQKLLDGLDLSMSYSGISAMSSGESFIRMDKDANEKGKRGSHTYSVFKGSQNDITELSGVSSTSGVWPLDIKEGEVPKGDHLPYKEKGHVQEASKAGVKKSHSETVTSTKIPVAHSGSRTPSKVCRVLVEKHVGAPEKDASTSRQSTENVTNKPEKLFSGKASNEASDEGSVLVVEVGRLSLSPSILPQKNLDKNTKVSGIRVMHRSRVCYLTTLDVSFPHLELPPDWDISQTCASRQLSENNEVHYSAKEVLKLPPAHAIEILRGQLIVRCVRRRLGERNSEELGSAAINLMDIWQLNGSEVRVPLFRSEGAKDDDDSLTRKQGRKGKKKENDDEPVAHFAFTSKLALTVSQPPRPPESHKSTTPKVVPSKSDLGGESTETITMESSLDLSKNKKLMDGSFSYCKGTEVMEDSFSSVDMGNKEDSILICPVPRPPSVGESVGQPRLPSVYIPSHLASREAHQGSWQQSVDFRQVKVLGDIRSAPIDTRVVNSSDSSYPAYGTFLTDMNGHEESANKPIESGGESPCIQTVPDFHADLLSNGALRRSSVMESSDEDFCRVHLEVIKGRNLPWIEGPDHITRPPNCYVRTNLGSLTIQTNVCNEMDNPVWNFAADVLLPYSQLIQTEGSLILKVHHTPWEQHSSPDDPLLGFVCVDATSIWSGHVSLCGWYPLLDLLGCVRGHIKVSLTPHEPPQPIASQPVHRYPVSIQEHPVQQPSHDPRSWKQSYPQHLSVDRDIPSSPRHYVGRGGMPNTCRVPFYPRYAYTIPQASPRFSRRNVQQERIRAQGYTGSMNGMASQNQDSSIYSNYSSSMISSESVIVDVPALNEIPKDRRKSEDMMPQRLESSVRTNRNILSKSSESLNNDAAALNEMSTYKRRSQDITPQKLEPSSKADKNMANKNASSIPVFSPGRDTNRRSSRSSAETRNLTSVLPEILYQENMPQHFASDDQLMNRSTGMISGRGSMKEPCRMSQSLQETYKGSGAFPSFSSEYELSRGSPVPKDSLILAHSQLQRREEQKLEKAPTKSCAFEERNMIKEHQSKMTASPIAGSSVSSGKPSSCLKVPGSPSLRAKHVTFANRLVQQKGAEVKGGTHSIQDKPNRSPSALPRLAQPSPLHHNVASTNMKRNEENTDKNSSARDSVSGEPRYADGSDLQVVPCREGDTQVVTTTVSVPGSRTKYCVSGDSKRGPHNNQLSCDKNRSDLIMSFSWMNQTSDCDTPCVSYIESKNAMQGGASATGNAKLKTPEKKKEGKGLVEKSRKLRSRLAANFPLK